jgi:hypothetical protein
VNPITPEEVLTLLNSRSAGLTRKRMAELGLELTGDVFVRCHAAGGDYWEDRFRVSWTWSTLEHLGCIVDTHTDGLLEELKLFLARRGLEQL